MSRELRAAYELIAAQEPIKLTDLSQLKDNWDAIDAVNQSIYYARIILKTETL